MKTITGSLPYKKNNIKRDKNNSTKVIIPLTRTRTFVLQRKRQYPIDATEKILRRKIQNSDLLTSWRLVLFQLICILRWQLVMHFWLPSNHPGANMLCGMEFNEFRPPNSSDDLCLLFCLFLLLCLLYSVQCSAFLLREGLELSECLTSCRIGEWLSHFDW